METAVMGQSHISRSCRQQLHAAWISLIARWITGQAKSSLDAAAERDVDSVYRSHSCWAPLPLPLELEWAKSAMSVPLRLAR
jgi:hypothetical protein